MRDSLSLVSLQKRAKGCVDVSATSTRPISWWQTRRRVAVVSQLQLAQLAQIHGLPLDNSVAPSLARSLYKTRALPRTHSLQTAHLFAASQRATETTTIPTLATPRPALLVLERIDAARDRVAGLSESDGEGDKTASATLTLPAGWSKRNVTLHSLATEMVRIVALQSLEGVASDAFTVFNSIIGLRKGCESQNCLFPASQSPRCKGPRRTLLRHTRSQGSLHHRVRSTAVVRRDLNLMSENRNRRSQTFAEWWDTFNPIKDKIKRQPACGEVKGDQIIAAGSKITLNRTLRVPSDDEAYDLPPVRTPLLHGYLLHVLTGFGVSRVSASSHSFRFPTTKTSCPLPSSVVGAISPQCTREKRCGLISRTTEPTPSRSQLAASTLSLAILRM